jgi:tetratricopeptide (TPR) repeat protein
MHLKLKLLDLLERAYKEEQAFIEGLDENERATAGTPERWAVKDVIAHVAAWKERTAQELAAVARAESPPDFGSLAQFNTHTFRQHQNLAWTDVLAQSAPAHRRLQAKLESTPDHILTGLPASGRRKEPVWWLVVGRGFTHPLGHLAHRCVERDDLDAAIGIHERVAALLLGLDISPAWQALVRYRLARRYVGLERAEQAIVELRQAFRLEPDLIKRSKNDPSFAALRENPAYHALCAES